MGLAFNQAEGQTPLEDEEREGLIIKSISTRQELDEFEQQNIETAIGFLMGRSVTTDRLLSESFIKDLHFKMFGSVWNWAGKFRKTNKNIGVDKTIINTELKKLLDNCFYWINNKIFSEEEIAIRLKHRLVLIHPFPNGNGRFSRLLADIIMEKVFHKPIFSWGGMSFNSIADSRSNYIQALREADNGNYAPLLEFAKS